LENKKRSLASFEEQERIGRKLLSWLNKVPDKPVKTINYDNLEMNAPSMALVPIQSAEVVKSYMRGNYKGEYQFKIVYRIRPSSNNDRLSTDELLNRMGDWTKGQRPDIGKGLGVLKIEPTTRAAKLASYEDGDEDRQILMKLTYYYKGGIKE